MGREERPQSFEEIIDEVQNSPDPFGPPPQTDFANPFEQPMPKNHRLVDTNDEEPEAENKPVDYQHHSEVYNVCNKLERQEANELLTRIANNKMLILRKDEMHWTKEGDGLKYIEWIELIPKTRPKIVPPKDEDDEDGDAD